MDFNILDEKDFEVIEFMKTDKNRINEIENTEVESMNESRTATYWDNNKRKLSSI